MCVQEIVWYTAYIKHYPMKIVPIGSGLHDEDGQNNFFFRLKNVGKTNFLAVVATGKNTIITMFSIEGKLHRLESGYGPVGVAEQGSKR